MTSEGRGNVDQHTVDGFGHEWTHFNQSSRSDSDLMATFNSYFNDFPWHDLPSSAVGVDVGCGSGRWARIASERVALIHCVDPSPAALQTARGLLSGSRATLTCGSAGALPFADDSVDFAYSLGVLHHTPDPLVGLRDVVRIVRPSGHVLVYLYYALDNRPRWFRALWRVSDGVRQWLSQKSPRSRTLVSSFVALTVYWPLARLARLSAAAGLPADRVPLAAYRNKPLYVMRTDALDRLGTKVEHRFTREQVVKLMEEAGLTCVTVSPGPPYWCAVGSKPALPQEAEKPGSRD
jgi:SAM-dependent methyltransferase